MRIRTPFAGALLFLLALSAYLGFSKVQIPGLNDKALHLLDFFALTLCFYWVIDTSRRRTFNLTLLVCTAALGVGSEFVQGFIPNGRVFDPYDILSNIVGSLAALALCSWYHRRMLERKRQAKHYHVVPSDEDVDVELGESVNRSGASESAAIVPSLDDQIDNWDENADDDWDEAEPTEGKSHTQGTAEGSTAVPEVQGQGN